jgi:hypothetical protein
LADVIASDPADLPGNPENARTALTEAVTATKAPEAPAAEAPASAPSKDANVALPEKFRNKSVQDVVEMYQNLESRYGSMANDLGVQRQLTDRLLDLKRSTDLQKNTPEAKPKGPPVTANDILDRPQETLERVVNERTAAVAEDVNARMARLEAGLAQQHFTARHPDFQSVVADPAFKSWVEGSRVRLRAAAAANQGNWEIADELLSEFKTAQGGIRKTDEQPAQAPVADLAGARKAALETSGNAGTADGRSNGGKKVYRRADLMRLRITDPEAYYDEDFQAEILSAHAEGRLK